MSQSVTRLKELLFETEARQLDQVSGRVDALYERTGTDENLKKSVATVLDGALKDAELNRHDSVSRALAPLIVATVSTTIDNSRDRIAEAIQPRLGAMVRGFIQSAMNDLMLSINQRIEGAISLRSKSRRGGLSAAELALADSQSLRIDEMYLLRRGSGELVAHWKSPAGPNPTGVDANAAGANRDAVVSGLVAGISALAEEAFDAQQSSLRTIDMQDARIFLRGSPSYILAAKCRGMSAAPVEAAIDEQFLATLDRHKDLLARAEQPGRRGDADTDGPALKTILPALAQNLEHEFATRKAAIAPQLDAEPAGSSLAPVYTLIGVIVLPLVAWVLWSAWTTFETRRTRVAAEAVLESMPALRGYPLTLTVDSGGHAMTISGLAPTVEAREALVAGLRRDVPSAELRDHLAVLPAGIDPEPGLADLARAALARSLARTEQQIKNLDGELLALAQKADAGVNRAEIARARADLGTALQRVAELRPRLASDRRALDALAPAFESAHAALAAAESRLDALQGRRASSAVAAAHDPRGLADEMVLAVERMSFAPTTLLLMDRLNNVGRTTPRQDLEAFIRANAVFFGNAAEYRNDEAASATLDHLARHLVATDVFLRVAGFTDERGTPIANTSLALTRAERVAADLVRRGVARDRLVAVGRLNSQDLSPVTGPSSPNRRVEFEIGFQGENAR